MKTVHDHLQDMHISAGNGWTLDNVRLSEVHPLLREADTKNWQAAHTDYRPDHGAASGCACGRRCVGACRSQRKGAGSFEGIGARAHGNSAQGAIKKVAV